MRSVLRMKTFELRDRPGQNPTAVELRYARPVHGIVERDEECCIADCPGLPGTNGRGKTKACTELPLAPQ
jgi:hypothetical protein